MHLINGNIYLFFGLQALIWFILIGLIYLLTKELNCKHLFLIPFLLLFGGTFFVHNFIGSFENDCFGIILLLTSFLFYYKYKNTKEKLYIPISFLLLLSSLQWWLWAGYLIRMPILISDIAEVMFITHWFSWIFLFYGVLFILILAIKKKDYPNIILATTILLIPKLFIFIIPQLLLLIDKFVDFISKKENNKFIFTIIILGLILGQTISVGYNTSESWNREITDEKCVLVNDEYFLRATKGINYTYNQINTQELKKCKQKN